MRPLHLGRNGLLVVALACGLGAAIACGSEEENAAGGGGGGDAKTFYIQKVHPSLSQSCNECHETGTRGAPVFMAPGADPTYTAIEGFPGLISAPSVSPIIQKGMHSGPALTQTQTDLVTEWLKLEISARKLGSDPGTPKNLRAAFKAFGACMDYNRWMELKLYMIAGVTTDGNQGQCRSCHNYGQASMWLAGGTDERQDADENALTFTKLREFPYVQRLVVGKVFPPNSTEGAPGSFAGLEASRRMADKGTEAQQQQANSHPRFALPSELVTALNTYVLETLSNMNAGRCQNVTSPDAGLLDGASP